ncbi:MAG: DLW-39 family protein [Mycobacteriales bacterium]
MTRKRPVLLLALVGAVLAVVRRKKAAKADDQNLWNEATSAPDLR